MLIGVLHSHSFFHVHHVLLDLYQIKPSSTSLMTNISERHLQIPCGIPPIFYVSAREVKKTKALFLTQIATHLTIIWPGVVMPSII